ncbi:hypothetical protein HMSSN036_76560 [Paenibacillus macerans]|nr:hypothetical protein HMSSN036_76560 [Paenibacillus macerans]
MNKSNETISLLMAHRSIRKFSGQPVSREQVETIVAAAQMASSSSNVQAYSVIAVNDPERKKRWPRCAATRLTWSSVPYFWSGAGICRD